MKSKRWTLIVGTGLLVFAGCNNALVIEDVNYAQYVESVLIPDEYGVVTDVRNSISFSITPLIEEESSETFEPDVKQIRLIRNANGYYFITADQFKHVYVFEPKSSELKLKRAIVLSEEGLKSPVFNWREPYVEVLTSNRGEHHYLDEKGIITEKEG